VFGKVVELKVMGKRIETANSTARAVWLTSLLARP